MILLQKGPAKEKKPEKEVFVPAEELITRYKNALDTSVKIATQFNVKPIAGTTIVFCNASKSMHVPCTSAKGLGKPRLSISIMLCSGITQTFCHLSRHDTDYSLHINII
jgi:telomerase protein component 1